MTTRLDISIQLERDMKEKIDAARNYNFTPSEIKRGFNRWNDFQLKPAIGFMLIRDVEDEAGGNARHLEYAFYGYTDTSSLGNSDDIYKLLDDIESFLESTDNTYQNCTEVQDVEVYEGGISQPINSCVLYARITYYT